VLLDGFLDTLDNFYLLAVQGMVNGSAFLDVLWRVDGTSQTPDSQQGKIDSFFVCNSSAAAATSNCNSWCCTKGTGSYYFSKDNPT
jgi:hypothetical protein